MSLKKKATSIVLIGFLFMASTSSHASNLQDESIKIVMQQLRAMQAQYDSQIEDLKAQREADRKRILELEKLVRSVRRMG